VPEQSDVDARAARRNYIILLGSATLVMAGIVVATIQFT
jgi:hypothetical protein